MSESLATEPPAGAVIPTVTVIPAGVVAPAAATVPSEPAAPPPEPPAPPEKVELIATAVRAVPGVADLSGGQFGQYTTYLPGRRVAGVTDINGQVTVAFIAQVGQPLIPLAERVRAAAIPFGAGTVEVVVADLDA